MATSLVEEKFVERIVKIFQHFRCNNAIWNHADFLFLQTIVPDSSNEDKHSTAVLRWLFDSTDDYLDTIIWLAKDGRLWILVDRERGFSLQRQSFVTQLQAKFPKVVLLKHDNIYQEGLVHKQFWNMVNLEHHKVGVFFEDFEVIGEGFHGALQQQLISQEENKLIELVDIELGVATAMAVKDEDERHKMRLAGQFSSTVLLKGFYDVFITDMQVRKTVRDKSDLEALLVSVINNPATIDPLTGQRVLNDSDLPDAIHSYNVCLTPEIIPFGKNDRNTPFNHSAVAVTVGTSCDNYYTETTRTYLFNPPSVMKDTYKVLLGMKEVCVASLVQGNPMKSVYQAAMDYLNHTKDFQYLQGYVPENLGFIVGLNHVENSSLTLSRTNEKKLEKNMVLSLRTGFGNLPLANAHEYSLLLWDMYIITDTTPELLTNVPFSLENICFEGAQYENLNETTTGKSAERPSQSMVEILESSDEVERVIPTQDRSTDSSFCELGSEEGTPSFIGQESSGAHKKNATTQTWRSFVRDQQNLEYEKFSFLLKEARRMASKEPDQKSQTKTVVLNSTEDNFKSSSCNDRGKRQVRTYTSRKRCFHIYQSGGMHQSKMVAPIRMFNDEETLPRHVTCTPITKSFCVEDSKHMTYLPYLEEHLSEDEITKIIEKSDLDQSRREERVKFGAECEEERLNKTIDQVLTSIVEKSDFDISKQQVTMKNELLQSLQDISANDLNLATSHWDRGLTNNEKRQEWKKRVHNRFEKMAKDYYNTQDKESVVDEPHKSFLDTMDSYRKLWCRRCYVYDCTLHAVHDKMSPDVQQKLALRKEYNGHWSKVISATSDMPVENGIMENEFTGELTSFHRSICSELYSMFEGDYSKMSRLMRVRPEIIRNHVEANAALFVLPDREPQAKSKKDSNYYSVKNYNLAWYNKYGEKQIFPSFSPCHHDELCTKDNCSCIQQHFFCTLACGWGSFSPNFFRGCDCSGTCSMKNCTCFALKRECDPDICVCTGCSDPPKQLIKRQRCQNDNIFMQRERATLIARSDISGWGLFNKYPLKAGDFIGEYVGEAITQEEAERRGVLYDFREQNYLFLAASDLVIDAIRNGNKMRFINHSENPNVKARILFVKGEQRIGLYACQNMPEQTELLFDYQFDRRIDDDIILKELDGTVSWMKDKVN